MSRRNLSCVHVNQALVLAELFRLIWLPWLSNFYSDLYQLQLKISYFTRYGWDTPCTDEYLIVKLYQCFAPTPGAIGVRAGHLCTEAVGEDYHSINHNYCIRSVEFQLVDPTEVLAWQLEMTL